MKFLVIVILVASQVGGEKKVWYSPHGTRWEQFGSNDKCAKSRAVFPKQVDGLLYMREKGAVSEYVLPADGVMVLLDKSAMEFLPEPGCERNTDHMFFNYTNVRKWFSTRSWSTDEKFNAAKPHIFHIPCECDTIDIRDSGFSIDLQFIDEIVFDKFIVEDKVCEAETEMTEFLLTKVGQRMFTHAEAVQFVKGFCNPMQFCGCQNRRRFDKYAPLLCEEEAKHCETPHCADPFTPDGHCCPICGAKLDFRVPDSCEYDMEKLRTITAQKLKRFADGKHESKIHFHAGMIPGVKENMHSVAQLVITEPGEFSGISVDFMDYLTKDENFKGLYRPERQNL